jgi:hypothetical protein
MEATSTDEQTRRLHMIWLAFLAAVALYAPLPWLIIAEGADSVPTPPAGVSSGLNFAALGAGVSSVVAKRWWTNSLRAALQAEPAARVRADLWARLRIGCLITWALSEAVAILGLALALITRQPMESIAPAAAAALLLVLHRPDSWPLQAVAEARESQA